MATKASRISVNTTLKIGPVEAPVGLMKATGDSPKARKWEVRKVEEPKAEKAEAPKGAPLGGTPKFGGEEAAAETSGTSKVEAPPVPEKPRKGVLKDDGAFVDLTEEIEAIGERSRSEFMEIISFIDARHVPRERILASYYVAGVASEGAELAAAPVLQVLAAAMRETGRNAVARFSKKKGQTLGILTPRRDGSLLLLELCFSEQWRAPGPKALTHTHVEVKDSVHTQAVALVEAMAGRRDSLDGISDLRVQMEAELAEKAEAGEMDDYELPPIGADADEDAERLGTLLQEAAAAV